MIPISIGAGALKTVADMKRACDPSNPYPVDTLTFGSYTQYPRPVNGGITDFVDEVLGYGNSKGLPNDGIEGLERDLPTLAQLAQAANKKLIISISGLNQMENLNLAGIISTTRGIDGIELNTACPNVVEGSGRKPMIGLSRSLMTEHLDALVQAGIGNMPVRVKVTPYRDDEIEWCADLLATYSPLNITHVVACNTIPGCLVFNHRTRKPLMERVRKFGGSGNMVHPWAVGNVDSWKQCLGNHPIQIIGAGGADGGDRVLNFELAGASECQIVGGYVYGGGIRAVTRTMSEYASISA